MIKFLYFLIFINLSLINGNNLTFHENLPETRTLNSNPRPMTCGGTSRIKKTTLQSPSSMPSSDCIYKIGGLNTRVCQLRIDMDMILSQPEMDVGTGRAYPYCKHDRFVVNNIELCGTNLNQHIYVPFDVKRTADTIDLKFILGNRNANPQLVGVFWSMTVTQIECPEQSRTSTYDVLTAPPGCLQYFHEPNGQIESFNFNSGLGPYLGNFDYGICIKRHTADQILKLQTVYFEMSKANPTGEGYDTDCLPHIHTEGGNQDYLSVLDGIKQNGNDIRASKYCGDSLAGSSLITTSPGPFVIHFHSDNLYNPTGVPKESGFRFLYSVN